jgi:hypothetical protein
VFIGPEDRADSPQGDGAGNDGRKNRRVSAYVGQSKQSLGTKHEILGRGKRMKCREGRDS